MDFDCEVRISLKRGVRLHANQAIHDYSVQVL